MVKKKLKTKQNKKTSKAAQLFSLSDFLRIAASAILLNLSFLGHNLGCLAWFSLIPLLSSLQHKPWQKRWQLCFLFGFLFFIGLIYWLVHVSLFGLIILCVYLSLEFSLIAVFLPNPAHWSSLIIAPAVWIIFERIRGALFNGFLWGLLGYTQFENIPLIQCADKLGVWGISFIIVLINFTVFQILDRCRQKTNIPVYLYIPILYLVSMYTYGLTILHTQPFKQPGFKLSMIQPNIAQEKKWHPDFAAENMQQLKSLTLQAAQDKPDLIVWPETSVPGYLLDEPRLYNQVIDIAQQAQTSVLAGSPREDYLTRQYYNSVFLFSEQGALKRYHDKIHLVPFGEYVPYKNIFAFLENSPIADFSAGKRRTIFQCFNQQKQAVNFGVLICFEDAFPSLVREFKQKGADFLITVTNEAWFKQSSEPLQHTAISVFRAIENRCWFMRSANTGISCFIDPYGRIRAKVEDRQKNSDIFIAGYATYQTN